MEPSLDVWAAWTREDAAFLDAAVARCARFWRGRLPDVSITWFDEKAAFLSGLRMGPTARCGFGDGAVAVAPSGHLYPCERLIGEDRVTNPMRIPGHALQGEDFLSLDAAPTRCAPACSTCQAQSMCNTTCRCSNYVRTGNVAAPDGLLCFWNQACVRESAGVIDRLREYAAAPN